MFVLGCAACGNKTQSADPLPRSSSEPQESPKESPPKAGAKASAHPADRCGECHGVFFNEWKASTHARARTSPAYLAMREKTKSTECERCHAPLLELTDPNELAVGEGVTCEVCHAIREVNLNKKADFSYRFALGESRKFGPLCDGKDIYFHKMGCAPYFRESKVCAGCHSYSISIGNGKELGIFTEYDEWLGSTLSTAGVTCQDCHMPVEVGQAATGATRQTRLGHHGFMGNQGDLLRKALNVVVNARDEAGKIVADVVLRNEGAGHFVPSGLPGRQIAIRVKTVDAKGVDHASDEKALGRLLVGSDGNEEVPFYQAQAEAKDDRIAPGSSTTLSFSLNAPSHRGELRVEVVWRSLSPGLANTLGTQAEERTMATVTVPFGERAPGKPRALLPKTMVYKP